jgi:DNA replication protein DnaC
MKRTADGLLVSDDLYSTAIAHQAGGGIPQLALLGHSPECANCGGAGKIGLNLLAAQGFRYPRSNGAQSFYNDEYHASRLITFPCPVCNTTDHAQAMVARFEVSGLEKSERNWTLDYLDKPQKEMAVAAARAMLADTNRPHGWLFVHGDNGVGKSGVLKAMVAAMCRVGCSARYVSAEDILTEIYDLIERNRRNDDSAEFMAELIHRYERYQLLAVDEIGADRVADTQFALSKLFNILETRYNRRLELATVIASNDSPAKLEAGRWKYLENRTRDGVRAPMGGDVLRGRG